MDARTLGSQGLQVSPLGLGCMGMSQSFGPRPPRDEMIFVPPLGGGPRCHASSTRRRFTARSSTRRSSARRWSRSARTGRDRHRVRLRLRRGHGLRPWCQQAEQHPSARRRLTAGGCAPITSTCSTTPRRPDVPIEDVVGTVKELIAAEGPSLRPVGGGRRDHSPGSRRAARDRAAERVLAVVARAGGRDPARCWRSSVLASSRSARWARVPHRSGHRRDAVRRRRHPRHVAAVRAGGAPGQSCAGRPGGRGRRAQGRHRRPGGPGLAACSEALGRSDPGHPTP